MDAVLSGTCGRHRPRPTCWLTYADSATGVVRTNTDGALEVDLRRGRWALHLQEWEAAGRPVAPAGRGDIAPEVIRVPAHRTIPRRRHTFCAGGRGELLFAMAHDGNPCGVSVDGLFSRHCKDGRGWRVEGMRV